MRQDNKVTAKSTIARLNDINVNNNVLKSDFETVEGDAVDIFALGKQVGKMLGKIVGETVVILNLEFFQGLFTDF